MRPKPTIIGALFLLYFLSAPTSVSAATTRSFPGPSIPDTIPLSGWNIIVGTESVSLNGDSLERDRDYRIDTTNRRLILPTRDYELADTLVVTFTSLPRWLRSWYGRDFPESAASGKPVDLPFATRDNVSRAQTQGKGVTLSGTKSFRLSARSAGNSEFSQSLSLNLTGELSPGLEISGAITDRGFDPAYGTLNSRLNELDKINIRLRSRRFAAQLGDITVRNLPNLESSKDVSGVSVDLTYPNWSLSTAAARPRGRYETVALTGSDGFQGPYSVTSAFGGKAIVPGSETVWLDGIQMERGSDRDYIVDYPTGRITFNVTHPIDARSRIEVDFEPLATEYKKELFAARSGVNTRDSSAYFSIGIVREGDDADQREVGELSSDYRQLLESAGDDAITVSGATADTTGEYIILSDSLPDTVYRYIGAAPGVDSTYRVTFSFIGPGQGKYRFLGNGVYEYAGDGIGDYDPVIILAAPERTDHVQSLVGVSLPGDIRLSGDIRHTSYDKNLFSSRDDDDNGAVYYNVSASREWNTGGGLNRIRVRRRVREDGFQTGARLFEADFSRRYFLPVGFRAHSTELRHEAEADLYVSPAISLRTTGSRLEYRQGFEANRLSLASTINLTKQLRLDLAASGIEANLDSTGVAGDGSVRTAGAGVRYDLSRGMFAGARVEHDYRTNSYVSFERGTRYNRAELFYGSATESLRWENHVEDTLVGDWTRSLVRNRIILGSDRSLSGVNYTLSLVHQWLEQPTGDESAFLGRLGLRYNNVKRRLAISSTYLLSEEIRNARGISYLQVDPGQGDYILEDGRYVPDADGDYIQVEELLSDAEQVRRGEKSFFFSRDMTLASIRFSSEIREELLSEGTRNALWAIPFYSDADEAYLFLDRRYDMQVRLLPLAGYHLMTLSLNEDLQQRRVSGNDQRRRDRKSEIALREHIRATYFEQSLQLFSSDRDDYYTGGGDVDGFRIAGSVRQLIGAGEVSGGGKYRRAEDSDGGEVRTYSALLGGRLQVLERGEIRAQTEFYVQDLIDVSSSASYQLTDNKAGEQGAIWSLSWKYGVRSGLRINFTLSGKHADTRSARILGRGEVIAGF